MNRKKEIKIRLFSKVLFMLIALFIMVSCNESLERLTTDGYPESGVQTSTGKVLCIIVDGASGAAINKAYTTQKAPNIRVMRDNAVFTFDGLADSRHKDMPTFTNDRGWANLMTGVTTHGIGLEQNTSGELKTIEDLEASSFLSRIKQLDANRVISLYAANDSFYKAFTKDADISQVLDADTKVKDAVIAEISSESRTPSDLIITQFSGVQQAGVTHGFYESDDSPTEAVVEAIKDVDTYIGEIKAALESRPNYKKENWLIVVTSTYGGIYTETVDAETYYEDPRLNTFTMIYNYRLVSNVITKPGPGELKYIYYTPKYIGKEPSSFAQLSDPSLFDIEPNQSYTIQFMFYSPSKYISWEAFLSKTDRHEGRNGWSVRGDWGRIIFIIGGKWVWTSQQSDDPYIGTDGKWHTVTMVFNRETQRFLAYIDGNYSTHRDQQDWTMYDDLTCPTFPLRIGYKDGTPHNDRTDFNITNLQIYDVALPAEFISKNHGLTDLEVVKNEYWDNLIGYWPCDRLDDMGLKVLKDYSQYAVSHNGQSDFVFTKKPIWGMGSSVEENLSPLPNDSYYQRVVNSVDIPFQTMQWLGLSVSGWDFEGTGKKIEYTFMNEN